LTPQVQSIAHQVATAIQPPAEAAPTEPNLPAPAALNGALRIHTTSPEVAHAPPAERLILIAPKHYTLDESTYQMLSQTGDRLVGVILVEETER
ncbi:MAG: hypothetical protein NZ843_04155, partial [Fimbriimonadales bacterium]|nr:hypothetical protein [Fimbriimonadales bacterium]